MKNFMKAGCVLLGSLFLFAGCAAPRVKVPMTRSSYTVSVNGSGVMSGVETVEIDGDWVLLDGRRLIPREKIEYIRADRPLPSDQD